MSASVGGLEGGEDLTAYDAGRGGVDEVVLRLFFDDPRLRFDVPHLPPVGRCSAPSGGPGDAFLAGVVATATACADAGPARRLAPSVGLL